MEFRCTCKQRKLFIRKGWKKYQVKFNIEIKVITEDEAIKMASENTDLAYNFVKIVKDDRTSYMTLGRNTGVWRIGDIIGKNENETTVVHEFFHSLGLNHIKKTKFDIKSFWFKDVDASIVTDESIINPRGTLLDTPKGNL